jgi:hypothetical protein
VVVLQAIQEPQETQGALTLIRIQRIREQWIQGRLVTAAMAQVLPIAVVQPVLPITMEVPVQLQALLQLQVTTIVVEPEIPAVEPIPEVLMVLMATVLQERGLPSLVAV